MTLEEPELTAIHDFTTLVCVILRRKSSEWLEWSIESDLGMRFAIEKSILPACFCDLGKRKFYIRNP